MKEKSEHVQPFRRERERTQSNYVTEEMARGLIAEKEEVLKKLHEDRRTRRQEIKHTETGIESLQAQLPANNDHLGKFTGVWKKGVREKWAELATQKNSLATLKKTFATLDMRYKNAVGEIDDIVLALLKTEAGWRKASTVERSIVVLKVASRAYKGAVDKTRHRANGILLEKTDSSLLGTDEDADEDMEKSRTEYLEFPKKELEILLQKTYDAGDAFQKAFNDYVSAMDKPPRWDVEIPMGNNVKITLDLVQNRELLNMYTPETIGELETRLDYLSQRLGVARSEITSRLREIRTIKSADFTKKKTKLSKWLG
ncbi:hypothetical protein HY621_01885 [Candidatus Uhrbacteria bacterium]|nr:hypothetical protein [Candidatus Uhrbacteria bacterium]